MQNQRSKVKSSLLQRLRSTIEEVDIPKFQGGVLGKEKVIDFEWRNYEFYEKDV